MSSPGGGTGFRGLDENSVGLKDAAYAYRVIDIQAESPLSHAGLVPWFDFIVKAGNTSMVTNEANAWNKPSFSDVVAANEYKRLILTIFNIKSKTTRKVVFTPNRDWGGMGFVGLTVKYDEYTNGIKYVVHVLGIEAGSPAHDAGLQPNSDYLLGTVDGVAFRNGGVLSQVIKDHLDESLDLFVYSSVADTVRVARLRPSSCWDKDSDSVLGITIGMGVKHFIPSDVCDTNGCVPVKSIQTLAAMDSDIIEAENTPGVVRVLGARRPEYDVLTSCGYGQIHGESADGSAIVELDWGLANNALVLGLFQKENFESIKDVNKTF
mmetsp:Transcript_7048/g.11194  ORF Transcript_7048/g.11194 Transcript_7048/m.11194 type:complete len:322 (+) Transcript_7048:61-1026(+)